MTKTLRELAFSEIEDIINRQVSIFSPDDTVSKVLGELKETGRYEAVVNSQGRVGLVTIRDLLEVNSPAKARVDGIWKVTGAATPNDRTIELAEAMFRKNVRAMPIVDNKEILGIISQADLTSALCDVPELSNVPAKDLMRRPVVSLDTSERVSLARRLMLERGFSHIPVIEYNRLVGIVTAEDIVHTFISPITKTTTGNRGGEKVTRFSGLVSGVMDIHPLTLEPEASTLDVVYGLRDKRKSAGIVVNKSMVILGILTPREVITPLLRFKEDEELPVYIIGLSEEDFFERAVAEGKVRRVVKRSMKMHPDITEVRIRVKRQKSGGNRIRYQMTAHVLSSLEQFIAKAEGWDLLKVFNMLCDTLEKTLRKAKHEPERSPRRRSFRR